MKIAILNNLGKIDFLNEFINTLEATNTKKSYRYNLNQFFRETDANHSYESIVKYKDNLLKTHKPSTVQAHLTAIKAFFSWAEFKGYHPDISKRIKSPKQNRTRKKDSLTASQVRDLLNSVDRSNLTGKRDYAILKLMITSGIRCCQIIDSTIQDIRTVQDRFILSTTQKGSLKGSKDHQTVLPDSVHNNITEYLFERNKIYQTEPCQPLFTSTSNRNKNGQLTTRSIQNIFTDALKECKIYSDRISLHSLRHSAASFAVQAGVELQKVMGLLGHRDINTTLIYVQDHEKLTNPPEDAVDNFLELSHES